jgi:hypothetical protein
MSVIKIQQYKPLEFVISHKSITPFKGWKALIKNNGEKYKRS